MHLFRGYRGVALVQLFMCVCFFINNGSASYGDIFGFINFVGAGGLFVGSLIGYFRPPERWLLWLLVGIMSILIAINLVIFIIRGQFMESGFILIAYDTLFVVGNLHFLGRGL